MYVCVNLTTVFRCKMASITKLIQLSKQLSIKPINPNFINSVRTAVNMRDWMPGEFPKNEEERRKAARKYNLHPDEYIPFPDNDKWGMNRGDYPNIPTIGHAVKDPYYPWDLPGERRNHMETVHEDYDLLGPDKNDEMGKREKFTNFQGVCIFFAYVAIYSILILLVDDYKWFPSVMEKQWPKEGVKHYTFESAK